MSSSPDQRQNISEKLNNAVQLHKLGQLDRAAELYEFVLKIIPEQPDALHLLGRIFLEKGHLEKAKNLILHAIEKAPNASGFYTSLGDIFQQEGDLDAAIENYQKALLLNPQRLEALCNMGNALRQQGSHQKAISFYHKALKVAPNLPEVHNNLGLTHQSLKQYDAAKEHFKNAISLNSNYFEAHNNLGNLFRDLSDHKAAIEQYRQALFLSPDNTSINYNLGLLFQLQDQEDKAVSHYYKAVEGHPPLADAHNNLGKYYQDQNNPQKAIDHYDKAMQLDPKHCDAQFNRSLSLLSLGRFKEGWNAYEWRFKRDDWQRVYPHRLKGEKWNGSNFKGKTLFIHAEQGFGDAIWFIRFLPKVKALGGKVILEVRQELLDLFKTINAVDQLVPMSFTSPTKLFYDVYIPLMSLACIFQTTEKTIPSTIPYLSASETQKENWEKRIEKKGFNVGITWAAKSTNEHGRSCPLKYFLPLFSLETCHLYGLQKGEDAEQLQNFPADFINLGPEFNTFADTAGAISRLDLIISVDTSVAHLAGAMGKPVWVLLPFASDWKWLRHRQDSPWYPTMRLFRQQRPGDWASVIKAVVKELEQLIKQTN